MAETRGYRRVRNVTRVIYVGHVRGGKRLKVRKREQFSRTRNRESERSGAGKKRGKEDSSMLLQREKRAEAGSCSVFE